MPFTVKKAWGGGEKVTNLRIKALQKADAFFEQTSHDFLCQKGGETSKND